MAIVQDKDKLVRAIKGKIGKGQPSDWHIGITNERDEWKKKGKSKPPRWFVWHVDFKDAKDAVSDLTKEGVKGEPIGDIIEEGVNIYVYIF